MIVRRKRLPAHLAGPFVAFVDVVRHVEAATAALTESMPSTRFAGRPLADALAEYEDELSSAAAGMDAWRRADVEEPWVAADAGLEEARGLAARVRLEAADPAGTEQMIGLIADLLAPLQGFEPAAERFDRLRVRWVKN